MENKKMFPVLDEGLLIPWTLLEMHEPQVVKNHQQTLEQLAARGGLDSFEIYCAVHGHSHLGMMRNAGYDFRKWVVDWAGAHADLKAKLTVARALLLEDLAGWDKRMAEYEAGGDEAVIRVAKHYHGDRMARVRKFLEGK